MPTPHIEAQNGDFAKVVLMPGDPKRAEWIAKNFLKDAKLVTQVRGIVGYTGTAADGSLVSVMASGMGMPSIGIYCHELFTSYGVEAIIRIGTCGAFQKQTKLKDLIIAEGACTNSNWMGQHNLYGGSFSAIADYELLSSAVGAAKAGNFRYQVGNIVSSDTFYDYRPDTWKKWANLGALGVEMEAFALYEQAAELGKKALAICSVSDSFVNEGILTPEERQEGLSAMVMVALVTAEKFNACRTK
ncbi:MAG: purine-nucleoside phosphorylase [Bacilli bacterium]